MIPKFRAWDKFDKCIYKVHVIDFDAKAIWINEIFDHEDIPHSRDFNEVEIMQSTGLKDKNGTEIYEGDIVESTHYDLKDKHYRKRGIIGRDDNDNRVILYSSKNYPNKPKWFYTPHSIYYAKDIKVIGNVFENEILLEETLSRKDDENDND